jgi:hypothetical protein
MRDLESLALILAVIILSFMVLAATKRHPTAPAERDGEP